MVFLYVHIIYIFTRFCKGKANYCLEKKKGKLLVSKKWNMRRCYLQTSTVVSYQVLSSRTFYFETKVKFSCGVDIADLKNQHVCLKIFFVLSKTILLDYGNLGVTHFHCLKYKRGKTAP